MLTVLAPISGWVSPLGEVPDTVFSDKILGDGVAVDPVEGRLVAPCDGVIASLAAHAVTIRAANGAEILTHVGLETVALKGAGFKALAKEGDSVKAGDPLIAFDLDYLAAHARSLISPVIIANGDRFRITRRTGGRLVASGDFLLEIEPLAAAATADSKGEAVSLSAIVAAEHGLHARPSALVAKAAKPFDGEVTLSLNGRTANAKSATALMTLGAHKGDEVVVTAPSRQAAEAVATALAIMEAEPRVMAVAETVRADTPNTATRLHGVPAAPGRSVGVTVRLRAKDIAVPETGDGIAGETAALRAAIAAARVRLDEAAISGDRARRDILLAHLAILDDPGLLQEAVQLIERGKSAAFAWRSVLRASAETLRRMDDARMRERAGDLLDLERQVLSILIGNNAPPLLDLPSSAILIADEIVPSDLVAGVAGFVSAGGGPTSHAAILAAGMSIPALVGVGETVLKIADGTTVLLDASAGLIDLAPDSAAISQTRQREAEAAARRVRERAEAVTDCVMADGVRVEIFANLGKGAAEAAEAVAFGAEGCGVLRTEFLFMDRAAPPGEDEQLAAYQGIADALAGRPFILRTFDIGADKSVPYLSFPPETNPQLGMRGVRTAALWPDLLRTQLMAAARVKGTVKIMLPMITDAAEIGAVRTMLEEDCAKRGLPVPSVGAMVETPSAALTADLLVREADFLSIGTNDLTQYVLAVDRGHPALSQRLDGMHPAVLRLIARVGEAAQAAGKTAAVCGSIAADPVAAPVLIGLGISELSVPAPVIPRLKAAIRDLTLATCQAIARQALNEETPAAVRAFVKANVGAEDLS